MKRFLCLLTAVLLLAGLTGRGPAWAAGDKKRYTFGESGQTFDTNTEFHLYQLQGSYQQVYFTLNGKIAEAERQQVDGPVVTFKPGKGADPGKVTQVKFIGVKEGYEPQTLYECKITGGSDNTKSEIGIYAIDFYSDSYKTADFGVPFEFIRDDETKVLFDADTMNVIGEWFDANGKSLLKNAISDGLLVWPEKDEGSLELTIFKKSDPFTPYITLKFRWEEDHGQRVLKQVLPQPAPTESPVPTQVPTPVPTEEPTPVPTEEPTPVPTEEPTPVPTEEPTPVPIETPIPETDPGAAASLFAGIQGSAKDITNVIPDSAGLGTPEKPTEAPAPEPMKVTGIRLADAKTGNLTALEKEASVPFGSTLQIAYEGAFDGDGLVLISGDDAIDIAVTPDGSGKLLKADLKDVPAGAYALAVRYSGGDGVPEETGYTLTIEPPAVEMIDPAVQLNVAYGEEETGETFALSAEADAELRYIHEGAKLILSVEDFDTYYDGGKGWIFRYRKQPDENYTTLVSGEMSLEDLPEDAVIQVEYTPNGREGEGGSKSLSVKKIAVPDEKITLLYGGSSVEVKDELTFDRDLRSIIVAGSDKDTPKVSVLADGEPLGQNENGVWEVKTLPASIEISMTYPDGYVPAPVVLSPRPLSLSAQDAERLEVQPGAEIALTYEGIPTGREEFALTRGDERYALEASESAGQDSLMLTIPGNVPDGEYGLSLNGTPVEGLTVAVKKIVPLKIEGVSVLPKEETSGEPPVSGEEIPASAAAEAPGLTVAPGDRLQVVTSGDFREGDRFVLRPGSGQSIALEAEKADKDLWTITLPAALEDGDYVFRVRYRNDTYSESSFPLTVLIPRPLEIDTVEQKGEKLAAGAKVGPGQTLRLTLKGIWAEGDAVVLVPAEGEAVELAPCPKDETAIDVTLPASNDSIGKYTLAIRHGEAAPEGGFGIEIILKQGFYPDQAFLTVEASDGERRIPLICDPETHGFAPEEALAPGDRVTGLEISMDYKHEGAGNDVHQTTVSAKVNGQPLEPGDPVYALEAYGAGLSANDSYPKDDFYRDKGITHIVLTGEAPEGGEDERSLNEALASLEVAFALSDSDGEWTGSIAETVPAATPTPEPSPTPTATATPAPTATPTPTPEPTPTPAPAIAKAPKSVDLLKSKEIDLDVDGGVTEVQVAYPGEEKPETVEVKEGQTSVSIELDPERLRAGDKVTLTALNGEEASSEPMTIEIADSLVDALLVLTSPETAEWAQPEAEAGKPIAIEGALLLSDRIGEEAQVEILLDGQPLTETQTLKTDDLDGASGNEKKAVEAWILADTAWTLKDVTLPKDAAPGEAHELTFRVNDQPARILAGGEAVDSVKITPAQAPKAPGWVIPALVGFILLLIASAAGLVVTTRKLKLQKNALIEESSNKSHLTINQERR